MNQFASRLPNGWKRAAGALVVTVLFCGQAEAVNDVMSKWTMEGITASTAASATQGPFNAELGFGNTVTGVHTNATTVWSTPVGNGSAKSFSANVWTAGDYWEFTADDMGSGFSNYGLQFDQVSSTTGPRDWIVQYSTGGPFIDFATYSVGPNATPAWSGAGAVAPFGLDTYDFDLRSITALNGNPAAKIRLTAATPIVAAQQGSTPATAGTDRVDNVSIFYNYDPTQTPVTQPDPAPLLPVTGDIVFGIGSGRKETTLELVRGSVVLNGGTKPRPYSSWTAQNFIRFVKFDNLGTQHNANGNLLGVDPGATAANGGNIYSLATQGSIPSPAPQLLATTNTASGAATTIGGLSVAPNNAKVALTGLNTGKVLAYTYTAGNTLGTGTPSLSGLLQSAVILGTGANYSTGTQQGTAWKDNNVILAFSGEGNLYEVDTANAMANSLVETVPVTAHAQKSTAVAYNPSVSPYVYATYSSFSSTAQSPPSTTTNKLFVFDPSAGYADLTSGGIDFSTSAFAIRDIALDASGNLFMSTAASSGGGQGRIEYIPGVGTPGSITANSSVDWYLDEVFGGVNSGLDIGFAPPAGLPGDFNNNGKVDAGDYVIWRKNETANAALPNDTGLATQAARFDLWRANFGNPPGSGSGLGGAGVPEPAGLVLVLLGLVSICLQRRSK